jgi:hypothetical protein
VATKDQVARDHAEVRDVAHRSGLHVQPLRACALLQQPDLLGPDREPLPVALDDVRHAHEAGHELIRGMLVHLGRGPDLLDAARVEHGQAVAHRQRLVLVVRDVDECDPHLALDALELALHLLAQLEIERAERLVEEQHARAVDDRARQRDALALAARELGGLALAVTIEAHHGQRLAGARAALGPVDPADPQPVLDVLAHAHVREERVVLEHRVDIAGMGWPAGDVRAGQLEAAGVGKLEAGDQAQRGRLPRPRWPEQREELPAGDRDRDRVDRDDVAVALDELDQPNVGPSVAIRSASGRCGLPDPRT